MFPTSGRFAVYSIDGIRNPETWKIAKVGRVLPLGFTVLAEGAEWKVDRDRFVADFKSERDAIAFRDEAAAVFLEASRAVDAAKIAKAEAIHEADAVRTAAVAPFSAALDAAKWDRAQAVAGFIRQAAGRVNA